MQHSWGDGGNTKGSYTNNGSDGWYTPGIVFPQGRGVYDGSTPIFVESIWPTAGSGNRSARYNVGAGEQTSGYHRYSGGHFTFYVRRVAGTIYVGLLASGTHVTRWISSNQIVNWSPNGPQPGAMSWFQAPSAPSFHSVTPSATDATKATVVFSGPADDGGKPVYSYTIQRATDPSFTQNVVNTNTIFGTTEVTGLTPGQTYYWRIMARTQVTDGNGLLGGAASAVRTSFQGQAPQTAPGFTLSPQPSGTATLVTLTPPSNNGGVAINGYDVEWRYIAPPPIPPFSTGSGSTTTNTLMASPLAPGATYEYRARAKNSVGAGPWSDWSSVSQPQPSTNPGDFFDGNTPDTPQTTYAWTGTTNNSTSTAVSPGVLGWEIDSYGLDTGDAVLHRAIGGIYGDYGARVVVKADCGSQGLVYTEGFEVGLARWAWGWSNYGMGPAIAISQTTVHSGLRSLRMTDVATVADDATDVYVTLPFDDWGDGEYVISAWVYIADGTSARLAIDGNIVDVATTTTTGQWVQLTTTVPADGGNSAIIITVYRPGGGAIEFFVDDVNVTYVGPPAGSTGLRVGQSNAPGFRSAVVAGEQYTGLVSVKLPRPQSMAAELTWVDGAGVVVDRSVGTPVVVPANTPITLSVTASAPPGAVSGLARGVDVSGPGWSPWRGGESFLLDGGMVVLGGVMPYFDGSFPPAGQYIYSWEGTPHNSISKRITTDVVENPLIDPDCAVVPAPPRPPVVPNVCIEEVGLWRRYWFQINPIFVSEFFDTIPILELRTFSGDERQMRIRFYANPFERPLSALDQSDFCAELIVSYLPPDSVLTLDGISESAWASVAGGPTLNANHLLYGSDGMPATWPVLECGIGYYVTIDVPPTSVAGNISIGLDLATRY